MTASWDNALPDHRYVVHTHLDIYSLVALSCTSKRECQETKRERGRRYVENDRIARSPHQIDQLMTSGSAHVGFIKDHFSRRGNLGKLWCGAVQGLNLRMAKCIDELGGLDDTFFRQLRLPELVSSIYREVGKRWSLDPYPVAEPTEVLDYVLSRVKGDIGARLGVLRIHLHHEQYARQAMLAIIDIYSER